MERKIDLSLLKSQVIENLVKNYDEILLVGSGKGVASVKMIKQIK